MLGSAPPQLYGLFWLNELKELSRKLDVAMIIKKNEGWLFRKVKSFPLLNSASWTVLFCVSPY